MSGIGERVRGLGGGASLGPLLVLFGLNAVDELDRTAFGLLLPEIRDHFGLTLTQVTGLVAAVIPAGLVFAIPVAYLADRHRRVPIAVTGACAWAFFSVGTGLAPGVILLALTRIGAGLGRAVNDPVHGSLLSDFYPPHTRAKVFGVHRAANTVGAFFGPLSAGFLAAYLGWRAPFIAFAIPTLVIVLFAVRLREPERTGTRLTEGAPGFRRGVATLWGVRTLRRIWLAIPFLAVVVIALVPLFSLYYENVFGVEVRVRGIIGAFDAPFIILALLVGTPLIDRGIRRDVGRTLRLIGVVAGCIALLILALAAAPRLWMAIAFQYGIVSLAIVLTAGGTAIVSLVAPPETRASAFAFYGVFALVGVVTLPLVGWIGDAFGLRWGIATVAPVLVVGATVLASAGRFVRADMDAIHRPPPPAPQPPMPRPLPEPFEGNP